ncbi:MAG: hypothetical protein KatS3mg033_0448 [Thermonema sp.]|uniref:hypothetical protein n=1 Tax=Thermonema sp. TaxID=2231181 RepID=UPI0021DBF5E6|nr:hypothetical protein [Thermonema sp.]GIV38648.1 MAG: hypothetical protein KatS3mg033_0448 [Thermonema sp.]
MIIDANQSAVKHRYDEVIGAVIIEIKERANSPELKKAMRTIVTLYLPNDPFRWLVDVRYAQNLPNDFFYWLPDWWQEELPEMLPHRHYVAYVLNPKVFSDAGLQRVNAKLEQSQGTKIAKERYFASLLSARAWLFQQEI